MRQRPLMIEHRAEIAHGDPAAAGFAFEKMLGLIGWLHADASADDFPRGIVGVMRAILVMPGVL